MRSVKALVCWATMMGLACAPVWAEPAINQFEMKTLDVEFGTVEFQSQNAYSLGNPARRFIETAPGDFEYDDNAIVRQRHALELEWHLTSFFRTRIGIEFENEVTDDPVSPALANALTGVNLTEIGIEGVLVLIPIKGDGVGLGWLTEYQKDLERGAANSIVTGPIIEGHWGRWALTLNLTTTHFFGGEPDDDGIRDNKWDFVYGAQLLYASSPSLDVTIEAYGTVDRIANSGARGDAALLFGDHDQHRLGPVFYFKQVVGSAAVAQSKSSDADADAEEGTELRLGLGVLAGLNDNTPDATLKLSFEAEF